MTTSSPTPTTGTPKNALVVGGAGFIGSHLCDELVRDRRVICLDNFLTGSERNIDHLLLNPNFEFVRHDITTPFSLDQKGEKLEKFRLAWQGVQEIYYLASPTSEGDVERYPIETMLANAVGLANALDLAVKTEAAFLYASSDLVYGEPPDGNRRMAESAVGLTDPVGPRSHHVEAKRFGEALVTAYHRHRGLSVRIARIFNTYGPRMKLTDTRLVIDFIRRAMSNEPLTIYGGAETTGSYCYVADTVKGLVKLAEHGGPAPVNIGQDQAVKLVDIASAIVQAVGASSAVSAVDELPSPPYYRQLIPDIRLAKEQLGWFPVVRLEDGLEHTVAYLKASSTLIDVETSSA